MGGAGLASRFASLTMSPRGQNEQQSSTGGDNTAHLKGKLNSLYDSLRQLQEQLSSHKKEV